VQSVHGVTVSCQEGHLYCKKYCSNTSKQFTYWPPSNPGTVGPLNSSQQQ